MELPMTVHLPVTKYRDSGFLVEEDEIASEYPLTIFVNDEQFATMICSPDDLEEMVIGFLASESIISSVQDIANLVIDTDKGFAYTDLHRAFTLDPALYTKRRITSCCGKSRQSFYFYNDAKTAKQAAVSIRVAPEQCFRLMSQLHDGSAVHQRTGGVHNAALCTPEQILMQYSDIGRHNALDKIYGNCLKKEIDTSDKIIVISGRISSEMLLKAAKIGCGIILSKSAPTDLAIELAEQLGITVAGFIRYDKMNVYTHPERIILEK